MTKLPAALGVLLFLAGHAFAQQIQAVVPQAPIAPALGQLGAMIQGSLPSGPSAPGLTLSPSTIFSPTPNVRPSAGQRTVVVAPASVMNSLPQGAGAQKLLILLERASLASPSAAAALAPGAESPAAARIVMTRVAAELERMPTERLRTMPLEELNAWSARLLEGAPTRPAAQESTVSEAGELPTLGSRLQAARRVSAPAAEPETKVPPPAPAAAESDSINWRTAFGLFAQRSIGIAAFIAITIAYPFAAVPVVGWAGYAVLMAYGPMAGIAAGSVAGQMIDRLPTRTAMLINTALRGVLLLGLPAFHYFGVLNAGTLLIASLAEGWLLSTIMTTEGAFLRRLFPAKHLGTINSLLFINYLALQVGLGLIVGLGHIVDKWNPFMVFAGASLINLIPVMAIIAIFIPNIAPPASAASAARPVDDRSFVQKYWKEMALFAGAIGLAIGTPYLLALLPAVAALPGMATVAGVLHSPLPIAGALLYWISRTANFALVWRGQAVEHDPDVDPALEQGRLKWSMLYMALGALMMYPLQYFILPHLAEALVGAAGKGLLLGQFLGSLFFGNMISTVAQAKLPSVTVLGKTFPSKLLLQGVVAALALAWVMLRLVPGAGLVTVGAGLAAAAAAFGLMHLAEKLTARGWIKSVGFGFASIWLPVAAWLHWLPIPIQPAMFLALIGIGMSYGPSFVSLISYFMGSARKADQGKVVGIQGSFFNAAISIGYGLTAVVAAALGAPFPALLALFGVAYAVGGFLYWRAPGRLPGLPDTFFKTKESKL